jgi:hypothetical protein
MCPWFARGAAALCGASARGAWACCASPCCANAGTPAKSASAIMTDNRIFIHSSLYFEFSFVARLRFIPDRCRPMSEKHLSSGYELPKPRVARFRALRDAAQIARGEDAASNQS